MVQGHSAPSKGMLPNRPSVVLLSLVFIDSDHGASWLHSKSE